MTYPSYGNQHGGLYHAVHLHRPKTQALRPRSRFSLTGRVELVFSVCVELRPLPPGRHTMALRQVARAAIAVLFTVLAASIALTRTVADFYRGKSIDLYINSSVGGGYDLYARIIARHIGKHISGNLTILPRNMEGGGGIRLANWLYNVGPKDGTVIG